MRSYQFILLVHPMLEHLQRHRAVIRGCRAGRFAVAVLDPGLVGRGAVPRQRHKRINAWSAAWAFGRAKRFKLNTTLSLTARFSRLRNFFGDAELATIVA